MDRQQLRDTIRGLIVVTVTPFDDDYNLDLAKMTDLTRWWVENGLGTDTAPLKVAAAMGEGPMLSDDEWPYLLRTVVQAAGGRASIVCGLHYKDTKRTIEDAVRDLCRAFKAGKLPNSMTEDNYYNVKTMQLLGAK